MDKLEKTKEINTSLYKPEVSLEELKNPKIIKVYDIDEVAKKINEIIDYINKN